MRLVNDMMNKIDEKQPNGKETFYGEFYTYMQRFFEKVEEKDWVNKESSNIVDPSMRKIEEEKYKNRVKSYTSYVIGRKIS